MATTTEETQTRPAPSPSPDLSRLTTREWLLLLLLAAVQFTHILDYVIMMPLGPVFRDEMKLQPSQFGIVVAAYSLSAAVAGLASTLFLDRFGRKKALIFLYTGFTLGTLLCAAAPDYWSLVAARTLTGAFGGVVAAVILAVIGDAFPDSRRGRATGAVMSAFSIASIFGIPLGLWLADECGWQAPFVVLGGLGLVVLVLIAVVLPPLRGHIRPPHADTGISLEVFTHPNHLRAYALMVSLVFSSFLVVPYLATFLDANVGLSKDGLKLVYLVGGLATLLTMNYFGRLSDRFGKLPVFRVLALVTAIPLFSMTILPPGLNTAAVVAVTTLLMIATSGRMVPAVALVTASSAPRFRGAFMSLNTTVQHAAMGIATSVGGWILWQDSETSPLHGYPIAGALACCCAVASVFIAGWVRPATEGDVAVDAVAGPLELG